MFESCDNVLFKVHQHNLTTHSEGFTPPDGTTSTLSDEVVPLSESSIVLELLFKYMYPERTPDLKKVDFSILAKLAEAVEKYQVFGAMDICNTRMEYVIAQSGQIPSYSLYNSKIVKGCYPRAPFRGARLCSEAWIP